LESAVDNIYNALKDRAEGLERDQITPSKVDGLYTVTIGFDVYYMSSNGKYLISGDVIELATGDRVDGSGLAEKRKRMIATVAEKDMIIYPADSEKQTAISIFTDTTCPYCRKLHEQVPALSKAGIEVRYLAFPRAGAQSEVAVDMASIWCADDKQAAMTASKQGRPVESAQCDDPVAEQHQLGLDMQIRGTPAIILENGEIIAGYLPADALIQRSLAAIE
jgi:thiol:disulfide interchange protein DsbC